MAENLAVTGNLDTKEPGYFHRIKDTIETQMNIRMLGLLCFNAWSVIKNMVPESGLIKEAKKTNGEKVLGYVKNTIMEKLKGKDLFPIDIARNIYKEYLKQKSEFNHQYISEFQIDLLTFQIKSNTIDTEGEVSNKQKLKWKWLYTVHTLKEEVEVKTDPKSKYKLEVLEELELMILGDIDMEKVDGVLNS